jgi:hypothetical protein
MSDLSLTDLRSGSKNANSFATLIDAVSAIRSAGRLPSSVSDTSIFGYANMVTGVDEDAMGAWENRATDPQPWRDEVGRLGYELSSMVVAIKGRGGGARPSEEALAAAAGNGRMWRDHTDAILAKKPAPAKKPPTSYTSPDDIADGLVALGRLPDYTPRPFILGFTYGLLSSAPDFHQAWLDHDSDPQAFKDLMPKAARALSSEISRIQAGAAQASPPRPFTPAQEARMSDKEWAIFQQDFNGVGK